MHSHVYRLLPSDHINDKILPKVAIIDTGCQLEHLEIEPFVRSGAIAAWKDFVLENDSITDLAGHGTHVTHLLLKSAPHVQVYLGRAIETSKAGQETPSRIAKVSPAQLILLRGRKAQRSSIDLCRPLNTLSISGALTLSQCPSHSTRPTLTSPKPSITLLAKRFALRSRINNSENKRNPIGPPVRDANVICVKSTDDQSNKSTFSPHGEEMDYNFAILGEMVQGAWPKHLNHNEPLKRVSGTSQATPVLAAIASTILHIARLKQFGPKFKREWQLKQARGMSRVLYDFMTKKRRPPEYNYVTPGDLFNSDPKSIKGKIEAALDSKY